VKQKSTLLIVDGVINLALGILLAIFPHTLVVFLGIPDTGTPFYASILGAILTGIGIALVMEYFKLSSKITGLGMEGAITINLLGAGALAVWLLAGNLELPLRGYLFLWFLAILVFGVASFELIYILRHR
jgi:hypothetical protein